MIYGKMNPKVKSSWLAALRSGKFKQTKGMLERQEGGKVVGNCCLGVLLRSQGVRAQIKDDGASFGYDKGKPAYSVLTPYYRKKFGIDNFAMGHLWQMNDRHGKSFRQIATWISRNL